MAAQQQQQGRFAGTMAHVLSTFYCKGALGTTVNQDIIGCVWTGEFAIRCVWTGKLLNPERKSCGLKNIRMRVEGAL